MSIVADIQIRRGDFALDVALELPSQGITALFGPSGSGKTSILRAIAGLDRHEISRVEIDGVLWQDATRFVPPHKRRIGVVFQEASLFNHLSVRGNLMYGHKRIPESEQQLAIDQVVDLLGLETLLDRKPATLSGGQRQRVAIARALAVSPRILLMDEPLSSLDLQSKRDILPYFERLHRELEVPILYVSHSLEEVSQLSDHLVLLDNGAVSASGPIRETLTRLDLGPAHDPKASALLFGTVVQHDDRYHLTEIVTPAGSLLIPREDLPPGREVRLLIPARDVSLTVEAQRGTSILNIIPGTVRELSPEGPAQVLVRLDVPDVPLLARITRKSADDLGIEPGKKVFAQIKSVALLGGG